MHELVQQNNQCLHKQFFEHTMTEKR
jgi:hypothetical protein